MATFKLLLGLGMTVVLRGIVGARLGFPDLDVVSSSGATTPSTFTQ